MQFDGYPAYRYSPGRLVRRNRGNVLRRRAHRFYLVARAWAILWDRVPGEGLWPMLFLTGGPGGKTTTTNYRPMKGMSVKKRQALGLENVPIPALSMDSELLKKLPLLREFLSVTAYEDGSLRMPGSYRFENKLICYQITLYDADAGMRLPVSGPTIDDTMKAAERLLGAPEAPWEVDRYLTEQLAKKLKEKSSKPKRK